MSEKFFKTDLGTALLISGNILGSISMALISIGAILRRSDLPDTPLFHKGNQEVSNANPSIRNHQQNNYWGK